MTPEQKARQKIDEQLARCGWLVQNAAEMNISARTGVAIREFPLKTGHADYLLYADRKAIGVIEAKPEGHTLTGVETQSDKYAKASSSGRSRASWSRRTQPTNRQTSCWSVSTRSEKDTRKRGTPRRSGVARG